MIQNSLSVRPSILVITCLFLLMLATTGSQCSRVEDPAKTSDLQIQLINACNQQCNAEARSARDAEQVLHQQNVAACQALAPGSRGPCLEAEDTRHEDRMDEIADHQEDCKDACEHSQGGLVIGE